MTSTGSRPRRLRLISNSRRFEVIVIGAGQAGLAVGYHLAKAGVRFTILDANRRVGDSWRKRWDSLRLFTPAKFDGLVGMPFPAPGNSFPNKDQMADYLEAYAARFDLPILHGVRVERVWKRGPRFAVRAGALEFEADQVVVAMANDQRAKIPAFAAALADSVFQLHSSDYRNPAQLRPGGVLIVGAGNSGAEIAMETVRNGHPTWISGRKTGHLPFRIEGLLGRNFLAPLLLRWILHWLLTVRTPFGRRARRTLLANGAPLIRVKPKDLAKAGVERVDRLVGVRNGQPRLEDGRALRVANVIWCSGFQSGFDWIDLPVFGNDGRPGEPGLHFVGLEFLYAMSSSMIHGVSRDAARIVKEISAFRGASSARLSLQCHLISPQFRTSNAREMDAKWNGSWHLRISAPFDAG
jgi:putative flavoprotein involved in K+ transport